MSFDIKLKLLRLNFKITVLFMDEDIPRRERRFYREEGTQEAEKTEKPIESKQITSSDLEDTGRREKVKMVAQKSEKSRNIAEKIADTLFGQFKKKESEEEKKKREHELAERELAKFKQKFRRQPTEQEFEQMASNIFEQLGKEKREKKETGREKEEKKGEIKKKISAKEEELEKMPAWKRRRFEREQATEETEEEKEGRKGEEKKKKEEKEKKSEEKGQAGRKGKFIRRRGREEKIEEKEEVTEEELGEKFEVEDLFKEDDGEVSEVGEENELEELEKEFEEEKQVQKCPHCKKETSEIIYCPECGEAYCEKCCKKKEKIAEKIKYYCPACGKASF